MNRTKSLFPFTVMTFVILITAFILAKPTITSAEGEQCFIISLRGSASAMPGSLTTSNIQVSVEPQAIRVPKGSCVIFMNWVQKGEIAINFKEGKICKDVTQSPVRFRYIPPYGCYLSDYLQMGETSSLRFMQPGDFQYTVNAQNIIEPVATGTITVY